MTMTVPTTNPTALDAERADLLRALAAARAALTATVRGLTDAQAGERPTVSALCLGGVLKHVASGEEDWLRFVTEGPAVMTFTLPDGVTWADFMAGTARELPRWAIDRERTFQMLPEDTLPAILDRYARVAARTEEIVAAVDDLSATHPVPDVPWQEPGTVLSVREVLTHVIAETRQHTGHAEILRETLDQQHAG
ncbi:DinB family protein [Micromonospora sp. WMMD998]|uniref:DinB family protein n=1 Tax=Micromonospora sp. WMMD998 TaxID=3016092 RepID=UPI00249C4520|nr:DinB family protein [Micromonospora sp. WMMD998]WFE40289.1 DinB family protein [Micromonospora sp. WMMD998]